MTTPTRNRNGKGKDKVSRCRQCCTVRVSHISKRPNLLHRINININMNANKKKNKKPLTVPAASPVSSRSPKRRKSSPSPSSAPAKSPSPANQTNNLPHSGLTCDYDNLIDTRCTYCITLNRNCEGPPPQFLRAVAQLLRLSDHVASGKADGYDHTFLMVQVGVFKFQLSTLPGPEKPWPWMGGLPILASPVEAPQIHTQPQPRRMCRLSILAEVAAAAEPAPTTAVMAPNTFSSDRPVPLMPRHPFLNDSPIQPNFSMIAVDFRGSRANTEERERVAGIEAALEHNQERIRTEEREVMKNLHRGGVSAGGAGGKRGRGSRGGGGGGGSSSGGGVGKSGNGGQEIPLIVLSP